MIQSLTHSIVPLEIMKYVQASRPSVMENAMSKQKQVTKQMISAPEGFIMNWGNVWIANCIRQRRNLKNISLIFCLVKWWTLLRTLKACSKV